MYLCTRFRLINLLEVKAIMYRFFIQMEKILNEKKDKYKDTWKTANLHFLLEKLKEQLDSIDYKDDIEKTIRKIIHIANYCFFIWNILNSKNIETKSK